MGILRNSNIIIILLFIAFATNAQQELSKQNLIKHVYTLADDSMGGRNTATPGGQMAAKYISEEYRKLGLIPKGDKNTYLQDLPFFAGKDYIGKNELKINGESFLFRKTVIMP